MFTSTVKRKISYALKWTTVVTSFGGILISFFQSQADGYSHWLTRLLYFTTQSNIWIGSTMLILALLPFFRTKSEQFIDRLYLFKYIFTVSITVTGIVFCFLLGPFADPAIHPWSFSSFLTHVFTPVFSVVDFFLDDRPIKLQAKHVFLTAIPPLLYVFSTAFLSYLNVEFGRGEPFPYFFMNYRSPAGLFGFSEIFPYNMGAFYWIAAIAFVMLMIGALYAKLHGAKEKKGA